jgi:hypothetical protein
MYTGIVFLSSESPAWEFRSYVLGHCHWAIGSRPVLVCRFRTVQKKNGLDPPRLEDEDTTLLQDVIVRLPTQWPSVVSSKNGTSSTSAEKIVPQPSRSTQAGSSFNQWAAGEFSEITAHHEACLFVCLFVLVGWLVGGLVGWLIGWLAGWLASWLVSSRPFLIYCQ